MLRRRAKISANVCVLRNRVHRVVADVHDSDAALLAGVEIDDIGPGRGDRNKPKVLRPRDGFALEGHLIGNHDVRSPDPLRDFDRRRLGEHLHTVRKSRSP